MTSLMFAHFLSSNGEKKSCPLISMIRDANSKNGPDKKVLPIEAQLRRVIVDRFQVAINVRWCLRNANRIVASSSGRRREPAGRRTQPTLLFGHQPGRPNE